MHGRLGFTTMHLSRLCMWLREVCTNGDATWAQSRVVDLVDALLPADALVAGSDPMSCGCRRGWW
ncbi:hypothetical protein PAHAL_2G010400 [Panicum hallii]|uniref:Uncharacterized protein n=1 Tax=Panicum hallii TaxID=206008 RepID=A0A2T8KML0_9POAL|nr:hypothetical protein PAHAL_2G010400 [Panicum hallii]